MILARADTGATVTLPDDYYWEDASASPVAQSLATGLTGAALVQEAVRQWRPMTLRPWNDSASWLGQSARDTLVAWAAVPGLILTLARDGIVYTLVWRHADGPAVSDTPRWWEVRDTLETGDSAAPRYLVTLRFTIVSEEAA